MKVKQIELLHKVATFGRKKFRTTEILIKSHIRDKSPTQKILCIRSKYYCSCWFSTTTSFAGTPAGAVIFTISCIVAWHDTSQVFYFVIVWLL